METSVGNATFFARIINCLNFLCKLQFPVKIINDANQSSRIQSFYLNTNDPVLNEHIFTVQQTLLTDSFQKLINELFITLEKLD